MDAELAGARGRHDLALATAARGQLVEISQSSSRHAGC